MELATQSWHLLTAALLLLALLQSSAANTTKTTTNTDTNSDARKTVKKELPLSPPPSHPQAGSQVPQTPAAEGEKVVEINEYPVKTKDIPAEKEQSEKQNSNLPIDNVHIEHSNLNNDVDFPETYTAVFYVLVGITSTAILLLLLRVYRLRLSRAERKYGVQGDRANQELTPLPMAIEDVNSDEEEDHTLFEVNRQNIRIL